MRLSVATGVVFSLAIALSGGCAHSPEPAARGESPGQQAAARPSPQAAEPAKPAQVSKPAKPTKPADPLPITFEDLDIGMEPDSVYEPWMLTTRVKSLAGQRVRITGFMSAAILQGGDTIRTFPLLREKECPFGPGGQAHHAIEVELQGKLRTNFRTGPVTVEGVLAVRPWNGPNGKTWSLYHLEGTKIE